MKELKSLVEYASPTRLRRLSFLRKGNDRKGSQLGKLYRQLAKGNIEDDQEASRFLFGEPSDPRYYKVKFMLREQLINTILLVDHGQDKRGAYYHSFVELRKQLYVGEVLWKEGLPVAAYGILKRVLKKATKYEQTEIVVNALPLLRSYHVFYDRNERKSKHFDELHHKWFRVYRAEDNMMSAYDNLMGVYLSRKKSGEELVAIAQNLIDKLEKNYADIKTVQYTYYYFFIQVFIHLNEREYKKAIRVSWEAIDELKNRDFSPRSFIRSFLLQILASTLRFEGFIEGRKAVIEYLKIVEEGDPPWFRINQLYLYLCIQAREFSTAIEVTNNIFGHRKFRSLPPKYKEGWYLLRAYLHWLISTGIAKGVEKGQLHQFRIGRFINSVPGYSKDIQGMNIPVLIIQSLWLIHQNKYGAARDRLTALERYASRHLRNSEGLERTYYFIKAVCQLSNANFHRNAFERKAARYMRKLEEHARPDDQQAFEVEIIPYDRFFGYILSTLDQEIH